jgi:adenylate cyclase class 2
MQEIEVKARVRNAEQFKAALTAHGIHLNDPDSQHDTIYTTGDWDFTTFTRDKNMIRIRRQTGRNLLTLKRAGVNELRSLEYETAIADPVQMHEILLLTGYQPIVEVKKKRQKAKYQDIEICFDEIEGLGTFVELEQLSESSEKVEEIQEELYTFLETLGISREERETRGYDTLVKLKEEES